MLCGHGLYAQDNNRRMLGIDEMFRLADENSSSIKSYSTGKDAAAMALKSAKAQRLPDINASLSASYLGDGNLWDRDFSNGQTISMPHFGNNFALQASMTVYAGGAINSGIALAELGEQMATLDWQKNRQDIRFILTGYYLNLFKLNNQAEVLEKNIELTKLVIKNMVARRKQGSALKNDITRYELQLENQKLQLTKVNDAKKIMNHQLVTRAHGAIVYERFNDKLVGKGYALEYLLDRIGEEYGDVFDAYMVFDADNLLSEDYISRMNETFSDGYRIITSYRNSKNYGDNWISAGYALWCSKRRQHQGDH